MTNTTHPQTVLATLLHELRSAGFLADVVGTGGGCEAVLVGPVAGRQVLITNGNACVPYIPTDVTLAPEDVDEDIVAVLYHDDEGHIIIDHSAEEGHLPASIIVAACRSALGSLPFNFERDRAPLRTVPFEGQ